jgi:cytochrome c553
VAGQYQEYILAQLKAFQTKERTNDAGNMTAVMRGLSEDDLENLSHYIAGIN